MCGHRAGSGAKLQGARAEALQFEHTLRAFKYYLMGAICQNKKNESRHKNGSILNFQVQNQVFYVKVFIFKA